MHLNEWEQYQQQLAQNGLQHFPEKGLGPGHGWALGKRKTSAELINEAKIYLNDVGGANAANANRNGTNKFQKQNQIK